MPDGISQWNVEPLLKKVRQSLAAGLSAGAIELQNTMKLGLSKVYPRVRLRTGIRRDGSKTRRAMFNAAPPGAYPGKRTGNLRRSISHQNANADTLVAKAGVQASRVTENTYALWLEFGTTNMAPRPWAYRSLSENRAKIAATISAAARLHFGGDYINSIASRFGESGPERITPNQGAD